MISPRTVGGVQVRVLRSGVGFFPGGVSRIRFLCRLRDICIGHGFYGSNKFVDHVLNLRVEYGQLVMGK